MAALCVRGRANLNLLHRLAIALFLIAGVLRAAAADADAAGPIVVRLDQATIMNLPVRAATVVIGNPLIADVSIVRSEDRLFAVLTGKGYGATNVVVMDHGGAVLAEKTVEVTGPDDPIVVVYNGVKRQTYSCTPICSPRITLGDYRDYFLETLAETTTRNTQAVKRDSANSTASVTLSGGGATAGSTNMNQGK